MSTDPHAGPRARRLRAGAAVVLFLVGLSWVRAHDNLPDPTDEAEWTAISVAHVRQLLFGEEPPGADRNRAARDREPDTRWRTGVQASTFGWPNPGLVKTIWGLAALARGQAGRNLPPEVFQRYHRGDPKVRWQGVVETEPIVPTLSATVAAATAASGVLLFLLASALAGPVAGLVAWALWLGNPLVAAWSRFVRPDLFMVLFALATLWVACARLLPRPGAGSRRGAAGAVGTGVALGLAAGAAVSCKLNGGLAAVFVALAVPIAAAFGREPGRARRAAVTLAVSGAVAAALFVGTWPYLWHDPLGGLAETLDFWERHMAFQQERIEAFGGIAVHSFGDRVGLALGKTLAFEPLSNLGRLRTEDGYVARVPWQVSAGVLLVALASFGPLLGRPDRRARAVLVATWIAVLAVGTTVWLPLESDRYFFPYVACAALAEACLVAALVDAARAGWRRARPAG